MSRQRQRFSGAATDHRKPQNVTHRASLGDPSGGSGLGGRDAPKHTLRYRVPQDGPTTSRGGPADEVDKQLQFTKVRANGAI